MKCTGQKLYELSCRSQPASHQEVMFGFYACVSSSTEFSYRLVCSKGQNIQKPLSNIVYVILTYYGICHLWSFRIFQMTQITVVPIDSDWLTGTKFVILCDSEWISVCLFFCIQQKCLMWLTDDALDDLSLPNHLKPGELVFTQMSYSRSHTWRRRVGFTLLSSGCLYPTLTPQARWGGS